MSVQHELPPLPGEGVDFSVDDQYKGTSVQQDRAIEALHRDNWTLHRVFTKPNAVLPLPPVKFPAGRLYLFGDHVAVVVEKGNGRVIASLPARAALRTLDELTPDILEDDDWAFNRWSTTEDDAMDTQRRWHKQSFYAKDGSRYTVRRTPEGTVDIIKDGVILHEGVRDADEADDLDLDPAISELVGYVVENPLMHVELKLIAIIDGLEVTVTGTGEKMDLDNIINMVRHGAENLILELGVMYS